jgi:hypothetical protein
MPADTILAMDKHRDVASSVVALSLTGGFGMKKPGDPTLTASNGTEALTDLCNECRGGAVPSSLAENAWLFADSVDFRKVARQ